MFHLADSALEPFQETTLEEYERACEASEIQVLIPDVRTLQEIRTSFAKSGISKSGKGRCLRRPIPRLGLEVGDRIEPSESLPDYAELGSMTRIPGGGLRVVMWRARAQSKTFHRNPIFSRRLGTSPSSLLADILHTLF